MDVDMVDTPPPARPSDNNVNPGGKPQAPQWPDYEDHPDVWRPRAKIMADNSGPAAVARWPQEHVLLYLDHLPADAAASYQDPRGKFQRRLVAAQQEAVDLAHGPAAYAVLGAHEWDGIFTNHAGGRLLTHIYCEFDAQTAQTADARQRLDTLDRLMPGIKLLTRDPDEAEWFVRRIWDSALSVRHLLGGRGGGWK